MGNFKQEITMKRQGGFSIALIGIVAVAIVLAALVLWRVNSQTSGQPQQQATPAQSHVRYETISDWRVRFKPDARLTGVRFFKPALNPTNADRLDISTDQLVQLEPHCAETGFASIQRTTQPLASYEKLLATINGYYYYYFGASSACSQNSANFTLESESRQLVLQSLLTLEAAP